MKKTLILIVSIAMAISSSGCVKESNAEPIIETVISESLPSEEETETETETELETESLTRETETETLKAEESKEELSEEEIDTYHKMMDRAREEVRAGKIGKEDIEDIVVTLYEDFLTEDEQKEFISELNSLLPQEKPVASTKPAKPKETAPAQPVPQETIPQEPVQEPPETYPVSDKIDTSGWDTGGGSITVIQDGEDADQSLTPEQIDRINNIEIN